MNETEKSTGLGTVLLWGIGVVLLVIGVVAALFLNTFDTQYAPGYSARAFKSIRTGDTEQNVLSLLGNPLDFQDTEPFVEWIYSADVQPHFAEARVCSGTYASVRFDSFGHVEKIFGERQISANKAVVDGDGENYLKLTSDQIRKLEGKTQNEIKQELGSPVAIYEYKAN